MILSKKLTIAVGMSGGVDSSVSALLLKQAGYEVFGLFMKNWEESDSQGKCLATKDQEDALKICEQIGIPFYTVNFTEEYYTQVFEDLLKGIKEGHTPNPDILCNKEIKFKLFLNKALSLGADALATGHYCRIQEIEGERKLLKGIDSSKDQTYFVYTLQEKELNKVLFPIGHLLKAEVREIAKKHGLITYAKRDSTGICFIGKRNFQQFISQYVPTDKGNILDLEGNIVGEHCGAVYYTIGQRKGLCIGGEGDAWFVVDKDIQNNSLIVAQGHNHPALFSQTLIAKDLSWVNASPTQFPLACRAKVRYRQQDEPCIIEKIENDLAYIRFIRPQRAVTTGQSIVFYDDVQCLGGGIIKEKDKIKYF
jgi:tRNA-specific 2-thiouridylase